MSIKCKEISVYTVCIPEMQIQVIANARLEAIRKAILIAIEKLNDRLDKQKWEDIRTSIDTVYVEEVG